MNLVKTASHIEKKLFLVAFREKLDPYPTWAVQKVLEAWPDRNKWAPAWAELKVELDALLLPEQDLRFQVRLIEEVQQSLWPEPFLQELPQESWALFRDLGFDAGPPPVVSGHPCVIDQVRYRYGAIAEQFLGVDVAWDKA